MSEQDFGESSLVEHLVELRGRLVRALLGLGVVLLALLPVSAPRTPRLLTATVLSSLTAATRTARSSVPRSSST